MAILLAALVEAGPVRVVSVTSVMVGAKQAVVIEASSEWGAVSVRREGPEVVATLAAVGEPTLTEPEVQPPLQGIQLERAENELRVRIAVPADVPYEVRRDGKRLTLLFGPVLSAGARAGLDLYRSLFPAQPDLSASETPPDSSAKSGDAASGIALGPLRFRPGVIVTYVDGDATITGPAPAHDSYFQVEPILGAQLVLLDGHLRASYEPRFRMNSSITSVNRPSHDLEASLELPVGPRFTVRAMDHYSLTTLDTPRADPGREYFFNLGRFTRNDAAGSIDMEVGPNINLRVNGGQTGVRFSEESAGFFSYDETDLGAHLELRPNEQSRFDISYQTAHVPPPELRPVAESTTQSLTLGLSGELPALIQGKVAFGYEALDAPRAPAAGAQYRGLIASGNLTREFGRSIRLAVEGGRTTYVSGFEDNAFYLSTWATSTLEVQLPYAFFSRAGVGYRWNGYRVDAVGLGVPRHDGIFGWTVGLGKALTRWSFLRVDYGQESRDTNVDALNSHSRTLMVQLGITPFSTASGK
jgi:Putative beta-barrel porin 2